MSGPEVRDAADRGRFEIEVDGATAGFVVYRLRDQELTLVHTEIGDAFAGQGLGGRLVRGVLDQARARGLAVVPECAFVRSWIGRHPDHVDLVPAGQRERLEL